MNKEFWIRADILRALQSALQIRLQHSQLTQIEASDPDFPRAIVLASKRRYRRTDVERWLAGKLGESHVTVTDPENRKPSKRPERPAKKRNHVRDRA